MPDTFYPDPHTETTTVDGYVFKDDVASCTWADLVGNGVGANGANDSATNHSGGSANASTTTDQFKSLHRGIFTFDTSSIPDANTVTSAVLTFTVEEVRDLLGGTPDIDIVSVSALDSATAVGTGDWDNFGSTVYASRACSDLNDETAYDWTLDATGRAYIVKDGVTRFGTRISWDTDGSFGGTWASNVASFREFYSADQTGTSSDPKLVVTHGATATPILNNMLLMGV